MSTSFESWDVILSLQNLMYRFDFRISAGGMNVKDQYQNIIMAFIKSTSFVWLAFFIFLNRKNRKRPIVYILIAYWLLSSLSRSLLFTMTLDIGGSVTSMYPYSPSNRQTLFVSKVLSFSGEIFGDWYFYLRTKAIASDNKKIKLLFCILLSYNLSKVIAMFAYLIRVIYSEDPKYKVVWFTSIILIQAISIIYECCIIYVLRTTLYYKNKDYKILNINNFLEKFKQMSEYRIMISITTSLILLPFFFLVSLLPEKRDFFGRNSSIIFELYTVMQIRNVIVNINYTIMYIDQILLKFYADRNYPILKTITITSNHDEDKEDMSRNMEVETMLNNINNIVDLDDSSFSETMEDFDSTNNKFKGTSFLNSRSISNSNSNSISNSLTTNSQSNSIVSLNAFLKGKSSNSKFSYNGNNNNFSGKNRTKIITHSHSSSPSQTNSHSRSHSHSPTHSYSHSQSQSKPQTHSQTNSVMSLNSFLNKSKKSINSHNKEMMNTLSNNNNNNNNKSSHNKSHPKKSNSKNNKNNNSPTLSSSSSTTLKKLDIDVSYFKTLNNESSASPSSTLNNKNDTIHPHSFSYINNSIYSPHSNNNNKSYSNSPSTTLPVTSNDSLSSSSSLSNIKATIQNIFPYHHNQQQQQQRDHNNDNENESENNNSSDNTNMTIINYDSNKDNKNLSQNMDK